MSEDAPTLPGGRSISDRDCSVSCEPVGDQGDFDLVVRFDSGVMVRLPMTPQRARALSQLLAGQLVEPAEAPEPPPTRTPSHAAPISLKTRRH